jgi:hypothetical protein
MKENYEAYLRAVKETLDRIDYLIPDDRTKIERGIINMELGRGLLASDDPTKLRHAASFLMIGAANIWSVCGVSDSEAEYWRRQRCRKGGKKESSDTKAWKDWALPIIARHPDVKASDMTNSLLAEKSRPSNLPGYDHLIRFVRLVRKQIAANKGAVRLVHSA